MSDWFALHVRSNCEQLVTEALLSKQLEAFFPRSGNAGKPFFPGYVFSLFQASERLPVIRTPHVIRVLGDHAGPTPIPLVQIESVRLLNGSPAEVVPTCPELQKGDEIVVRCGNFTGLHGRVVRFRGKLRVVCTIDAMERSVLTELDTAWLRPAAKLAA